VTPDAVPGRVGKQSCPSLTSTEKGIWIVIPAAVAATRPMIASGHTRNPIRAGIAAALPAKTVGGEPVSVCDASAEQRAGDATGQEAGQRRARAKAGTAEMGQPIQLDDCADAEEVPRSGDLDGGQQQERPPTVGAGTADDPTHRYDALLPA